MFERVSNKEWKKALEDLKTNNPGLWNYVYSKDIKDEDYDVKELNFLEDLLLFLQDMISILHLKLMQFLD